MNKVIISAAAFWLALSAYSQVPMQPIRAIPASATSTNSAADADWAEVMKVWTERPPKPQSEMTSKEVFEWQDKHYQRYEDAVTNFAARRTTDGRRWEGIVQMGYVRPYFIKGFKPEFDTTARPENMIVDEAAKNTFTERQMKLNTEVILSDDATDRQRFGALQWMVVEAQQDAKQKSTPVDYSKSDAAVDQIIAKHADDRGAGVAQVYLSLLKRQAPEKAAELEARWDKLPIGKAMKDLQEKEKLAQEKTQAEMMARAADLNALKFTAADGREVDLSKMRGKVVLIDFWATWCGPCINELPNVLENYSKYHDKGFEIVGISLENSGVADSDAGDAKEQKLEAAKKKMLDFTKGRNMPWPQYYDGKYWKNDYAVKYGVRAIPATFLLDQEGKIASTSARGPELETQLKKLLK